MKKIFNSAPLLVLCALILIFTLSFSSCSLFVVIYFKIISIYRPVHNFTKEDIKDIMVISQNNLVWQKPMIVYKEANENDANEISEVIRITLLTTSSQTYPKVGLLQVIVIQQTEINRMLGINTPEVIKQQMNEFYFICAKDQDKYGL